MAGQRSNQYKVDPGEFSAPDDTNVRDENVHDMQKQKVQQTRTDEKDSLIPRRGENPALADIRAKREAARSAQANDEADERADAARASDAERTE